MCSQCINVFIASRLTSVRAVRLSSTCAQLRECLYRLLIVRSTTPLQRRRWRSTGSTLYLCVDINIVRSDLCDCIQICIYFLEDFSKSRPLLVLLVHASTCVCMCVCNSVERNNAVLVLCLAHLNNLRRPSTLPRILLPLNFCVAASIARNSSIIFTLSL